MRTERLLYSTPNCPSCQPARSAGRSGTGLPSLVAVSTTEAGKQLGVTPARVRQLIEAGRLHAVRAGRRGNGGPSWLVDAESVSSLKRGKPGRPRRREKVSPEGETFFAADNPEL